jgi:chemotaxis protein methyltransferase CheR
MVAVKNSFSASDYQSIRGFLDKSCGIVLGENKHYLVQNRLTPLLRRFDLSSSADLVKLLQSDMPSTRIVKVAVIDAMTTNETFWFRDVKQFNDLTDTVLPILLNNRKASLKIWSAACSTGQEPYTISMCAERAQRNLNVIKNVQVIGTDIAETVLTEAKRAVYSELALSRGISAQDREQFFENTHEGYKLKQTIAQRVRFQQFNLLKPFSVLGRFDVIFCRNVLIYFSDTIKRDILQRMAEALEPGGYLFLSSTESMPADITEFESVKGDARYFRKRS